MTYPQVGEQMERRRLALKLSMRAAAKLGGVSPTAWSDVEAGRSPASLSTQLAVAKALDWPRNWHDQIEQGLEVSQPVENDRLAELERQVLKLSADLAALQRDVGLLGGAAARAPRQAKHAGQQ